jgi:hypothetical protein
MPPANASGFDAHRDSIISSRMYDRDDHDTQSDARSSNWPAGRAVDWPWPSAPAAEIEFAVHAANLMLGAIAEDGWLGNRGGG